jgi:hypothetical protein
VFDATQGTFTEIGALDEARVAPAVVATPEGVLVVGGWSRFSDWSGELSTEREASGSIDRVDFSSGTPRVEHLGALRVPRAESSAVLLPDRGAGTRVFVCGGLAGPSAALDSCELIDPATGASVESLKIFPRYLHTATVLDDGRVLIAGGYGKGGPGAALNRAVILDPLGGLVAKFPTMVGNRAGHSAHMLQNGMVLLAGGQRANGQPALEDYELYNP